MKKIFVLACMAWTSVGLFAQLKVHSNGNVGIQTSITPQAALVIGGDETFTGEGNWKIVAKTSDNGFCLRRMGMTNEVNNELVTFLGDNIANGSKFYIGMRGRGFSNNSINMGRSFGVWGEAGNTTNGYNYAVLGNLRGSQNGAAVLGALNTMDVNVPGQYAGYFQGDVRVTGNFYGTMLTPSASSSALMGRSAVMPLSAETDGTNSLSVADKLSQLTAVRYNLAEPQQTARAMTAGDTVATQPLTVTDLQALQKSHYGLDAEALKEVFPDLVYESQEGELCINYTEMIPLLVQSVNELRAQVVALQGGQAYQVAAKREVETGIASRTLVGPSLEQNEPNPFSQNTVVRYTLPENVKSAYLYIYDLNGKQVGQKTLDGRGKASVTLEAGSLTAGMYLYALVADGKVIDTKRMIITP